MSRLYDVGDSRPARRGEAPRVREDRPRRILPTKLIIVALGIAIIAAWQFDRAGMLTQKQTFEAAVLAPNFTACADAATENCVIDGDSFIFHGAQIRLADVDVARATHSSCPDEAERGQRAAARLRDLLNAGAFEIRGYPPFSDDSGEKLSSVVRQGRSIGPVLVREGLARAWDQPTPWCNG